MMNKSVAVQFENNLLCAIDTETTGIKPGYNEIIEITFLPLNCNFERDVNIRPFQQLIRPEHPDRMWRLATPKAKKLLRQALEFGIDSFEALNLFDIWFESLDLGNRRIAPLATNWAFDHAMLVDWLTPEHFYQIFHGHYRDLMCVGRWWNDRCSVNEENVLFNYLSLSSIADKLGVPYDPKLLHTSFYDCEITAKCYEATLYKPFKV